MWKRGTLNDLKGNENHQISKRVLMNQVGQMDKVDDSGFRAKLFANFDTKQSKAVIGCIPDAFKSCLPIQQSIEPLPGQLNQYKKSIVAPGLEQVV